MNATMLLSLPIPFGKSLVGHRPNERKLAHRGPGASPVAIVVSVGTRPLLVRGYLGLFIKLEWSRRDWGQLEVVKGRDDSPAVYRYLQRAYDILQQCMDICNERAIYFNSIYIFVMSVRYTSIGYYYVHTVRITCAQGTARILATSKADNWPRLADVAVSSVALRMVTG
jgi:hypothetical protein